MELRVEDGEIHSRLGKGHRELRFIRVRDEVEPFLQDSADSNVVTGGSVDMNCFSMHLLPAFGPLVLDTFIPALQKYIGVLLEEVFLQCSRQARAVGVLVAKLQPQGLLLLGIRNCCKFIEATIVCVFPIGVGE